MECNLPMPSDLKTATTLTKLLMHSRPAPAIPAVLLCMLAFSLSILTAKPDQPIDGTSVIAILVTLGIVSSCGLAIAAGFCSLAPQIIWLLLGWWGLQLTESGVLAAYNDIVIKAGMVAVVSMFGLQLWRIKTGRFQPTPPAAQDGED